LSARRGRGIGDHRHKDQETMLCLAMCYYNEPCSRPSGKGRQCLAKP
jgi:hypothetical protein